MKVLVTGSDGFIGQNLMLFLSERRDIEVVSFTRRNKLPELTSYLTNIDFIFHLAGINRSNNPKEFVVGNVDLTHEICKSIITIGRKIPIVYSSSTQATQDNPYGNSKRGAEDLLFNLQGATGNPVHIFRLPNIFGKWCKPNYNSVVATFCYNLANNLPIKINDPKLPLRLMYVNDVVNRFIQLMDGSNRNIDDNGFEILCPQYTTTVGELACQLQAFKDSRKNLIIDRVGSGLVRALYSTYMSYVPTKSFAYPVPSYKDDRGIFVEMLKTLDSGQVSYFTAHPGVTRGGHYHHSKTEKFLVIKGKALFRFRHMLNHETFDLIISSDSSSIVETIPGWAHDITNIGNSEMFVMLWANEVFDRSNPDTFAHSLIVNE